MNDEININLLLDRLYTTGKIDKRYMWALKDYITNLQKENEILRKNAEHNDKVVDKAKWNEMIHKSRNKKAIEYIKQYKELDFSDLDLLNILQGEDKE